MNNLKLFLKSLENKENLLDKFYFKKTSLSRNKLNEYIKLNKQLFEYIKEYKNGNKDNINIIIELLIYNKVLKSSLFVIYWKLFDFSYSIFLTLSREEQEKTIKFILDEFIKNRYKDLSNIIEKGCLESFLSSHIDSISSKKNGNSANKKLISIFNSYNIDKINSIEELNKEKGYLLIDSDGKNIFKEIIKELKLEISWMGKNQNKYLDFFIKINNNIFLGEHKHLKENGGTQDKQLLEIIGLLKEPLKNINYNNNKLNIYFIGYIDGIYLNKFIKNNLSEKELTQKNNILDNLKNNKNNFIVNTFGFNEILKNFIN